eukprot:TRINITY_DN1394_c0_g1_i1.p1 TRINITY_DN1394_c0_g1~~TRINITY_DN1394_c0_g1_i1.p1  ORF type:complete len:212 (-),score=56.87 TRINITY_DN1394_c0_g1_i1:83-718(-)
MAKLLLAAVLTSQVLFEPVSAFTMATGGATPMVTPIRAAVMKVKAQDQHSAGEKATFTTSGVTAVAFLVAAAAAVGRSSRTALQARPGARKSKTKLRPAGDKLANRAMLTVRKSKNNTHVVLSDKLTGKCFWHSTEKRYGKLLPNANRAVEAALFVAEKLDIPTVALQIKGMPTMMRGVIDTVRSSGINVSEAYVRNNIMYGGNRQRGVRR